MAGLVGTKLVAHGPLKWTRDGDLVAIEPGDVFEIDERDVEVAGIRTDLWLAAGVVSVYREPKAPKTAAAAQQPARGQRSAPVADDAPEPEDSSQRPPSRSGEVPS